jgi:hypothetical protein
MAFDVRYLILYDDVQPDPNNLLRLDVHGLMTHIRSRRVPPFPVMRPRFCVFLLLADCHGSAELTLRIVQAQTFRIIFRNQPRKVQFVSGNNEAVGIKFYVKNCVFPAEGLYWVELLESGFVVARQAISLTR